MIKKKMNYNYIVLAVSFFILFAVIFSCPVFAGNDLFVGGGQALDKGQEVFSTLIAKAFGFVFCVDLFFLLFKHDEKKVAAQLTLLGISFVVMVVSIIQANGGIDATANTVAGWFS